MNTPTEAEFRATGWTKEAINYPISGGALAVRCERNGIHPDQAPRTWRYAPNEIVRQELERAALSVNKGTDK